MTIRFGKLLTNPSEAITATKKRPSYGDAVGTLAVAAILAAIAGGIATVQLGGVMMDLAAQAAVGLFAFVLLAGLFLGLIVKIIAETLGGRGDYLRGLTAVAYATLAPSVGMLIAAIFLTIPFVGAGISFVVLGVTFALGVSSLYRGIKEMFGTDMITAFVTVSILALVLALAFWGSAFSLMGSQLFTLPGLTGVPVA